MPSVGNGIADIAVLATVRKSIGSWFLARNQDRDSIDISEDSIENLITRKDLIDVERLHLHWEPVVFLHENGRGGVTIHRHGAQSPFVNNINKFNWLMTLIVAALDTVLGSSSVREVVFRFLSQLLEEKPDRMEYMMQKISIFIRSLRAFSCVRGIHVCARRTWQMMPEQKQPRPGWAPLDDIEEIVKMLVWMSTGKSPHFATASTNAFCLVAVLRSIGIHHISRVKICPSQDSHLDESALCVFLDTRLPAAALIEGSIKKDEHKDVTSRDLLPFQYIGKLGMGASAVVDIVEDKSNGQKFAHKIYRPYTGSKNSLREAFMNEVSIMKRVNSHPHVVLVYWSYTCGRDFGMLLSLIASGGDLKSYLQAIEDTGETPTPEQYFILSRSFGCLSSGLAYIHSYTIRHKDIKPQNILVHNGQMIYTDFGIALDASGQNTTTIGFPGAHTKRYCAPEVAHSGPRNRKSDVFSLGCVFIEIMAVLAPGARLDISDPRPYWERLDVIRNSLIGLSAADSGLGQLFHVCSQMMESRSTDRIGAEALLKHMWTLRESRPEQMYELFCNNCEDSVSRMLQNTTGVGVSC